MILHIRPPPCPDSRPPWLPLLLKMRSRLGPSSRGKRSLPSLTEPRAPLGAGRENADSPCIVFPAEIAEVFLRIRTNLRIGSTAEPMNWKPTTRPPATRLPAMSSAKPQTDKPRTAQRRGARLLPLKLRRPLHTSGVGAR